MSWIKLDDRFLDHPKCVRLEERAPSRGVHLFIGLMSYCKQHHTDGRVPRDMVRKVNGPHQRWRLDALQALIDVRLVEAAGDDLIIHDWLDWNPSKEEITGKRRTDSAPPAARARAGRQRGDTHLTTGREAPDNEVTANQQHIKRGDTEPLSGPVLTGARARSESESESESILETPKPPKPEPEPPTQTPSTPTAVRGKRPRPSRAASQCPPDLKPDTTTAATAWELGFTDAARDAEVSRLIDWAKSKSVQRADWQATLRNWLRTSAKEYGLKPRPPRDAVWQAHQTALRKANETPLDPVKLPRDFGVKVGGSLFG